MKLSAPNALLATAAVAFGPAALEASPAEAAQGQSVPTPAHIAECLQAYTTAQGQIPGHEGFEATLNSHHLIFKYSAGLEDMAANWPKCNDAEITRTEHVTLSYAGRRIARHAIFEHVSSGGGEAKGVISEARKLACGKRIVATFSETARSAVDGASASNRHSFAFTRHCS